MGDGLLGSLLVWVAVGVLVFWSVGAYNRLVRLRGKVLRIFGSMVTQFEQYGRWMLEHAPEASVETQGPRPGDAWANLRAATAQFAASLSAARGSPMDVSVMAALTAARTVLLMAWQHVGDEALAHARGGEPQALRAEWEAITTQSQSAGKAFATAVEAYNRAVRQFPAVLLAWIFGFRPARVL